VNGFERRKEHKKENIRRAALELFQIFGFRKVSINDIAQKAGVSQVTIYNHFGSKEELVRDCIKSLLYSMVDKYQAIIKGDKPFQEKLEMIVLEKTDIAGQFQGELMQTIYRSDPEFIESFWQNEVTQLTIDFCEEGKEQGYISPDLSTEALLLYLEIIRKGVTTSSYMTLNTANNPKIMRDLVTLISYGFHG